MALEVIEDRGEWDRFIDASPDGLLFHKWDFLKMVERYSGYTLITGVITKGENRIALCPLFYSNRFPRSVFSPPPGCGVPYMGFVLTAEYYALKQDKKESFLRTIGDVVHEKVAEIAPRYTSIQTVPRLTDMRTFQWQGYSVIPSYTYYLDIRRPIEEIWGSLRTTLRRQIRSTEKKGLHLEPTDDVHGFYRRGAETYGRQGMRFPVPNPQYLEELLQAYPQHLRLYALKDDQGQALGYIATQEYRRFILWMGNMRVDGAYGNEYTNWSLIEKAHREKYESVEILGANVEHLCPFKTKFNPDLVPYAQVFRADALGRMAEWAYLRFKKGRAAPLSRE